MTSGRAALARLSRRDPSVAGLAVVLDAEALADALGRRVALTRVRYKPETSVLAAFESDDGPGWAAAYAGPAKTQVSSDSRRRAELVPGVPHTVTGPAWTDRALADAVRDLDRAAPGLRADAMILRHNPGRRFVLAAAGGTAIVKIAARIPDGPDPAAVATMLTDAGAPVLSTTRLTDRAWRTPVWGVGDLAAVPSAAAAHEAGAALAALHRIPVPAGVAATPALGDAMAAARGIASVLPEFAARASALAAQRPEHGPETTVHGDFSADQVLVDADERVRLIDLDRVGRGDPMRDLAAFAVEEWLSGRPVALFDAVCAGYRAAGGEVDAVRLHAWIPLCALSRAIEPFRRCDAAWPELVAEALSVAERWRP